MTKVIDAEIQIPILTLAYNYYEESIEASGEYELDYSKFSSITIIGDLELKLKYPEVGIAEYNGEFIFGETVYNIQFPEGVTNILSKEDPEPNNTYLYSILRDTIIIVKK